MLCLNQVAPVDLLFVNASLPVRYCGLPTLTEEVPADLVADNILRTQRPLRQHNDVQVVR